MSSPKKGEDKKVIENGKKEEQKAPEPELNIELKPGDYRVQINILEAKDIKAKGKAGGGGFLSNFEGETADPMVEVEVMGQSKTTDYKSGQLNPIFNEQLFFEFSNVSVDVLETAMIKLSLMDHDFVGSNNLIGTFTVDLSFIYKMNKDHELYKMWIAVTDMNDETQQINAFIKVTINVLGPGDKPPVHDPTKELKNKDDNGAMKLFTPGRVKMTGHIIKFNIYRAEHLTPLDLLSNSLDPYVKLSFAGQKAQSKVVPKDRNPEFNQELSVACKLPCMNGKMKCEIWDDDTGKDERVGTFYFNFKQIQNKNIGPRYANLYGPPLQAEGDYANLMTKFGDKGSHYRGRFLYSISSNDMENPKSGTKDLIFTFPQKPSPNVREKAYLLKIALYEGVELPEFKEFSIHVTCGPYETKSKLVKNENSRAVWNEYLPDLIIRAPDNIEDIYDVFIYLSTTTNQSDRICFKRLKASSLLDVNGRKFNIDNFLLEEDKSIDPLDDEQFPGIIMARIKMYSHDADDDFSKYQFMDPKTYSDYLLQIHLYMGRDFPAADETGAADPFIIARCLGRKTKSQTKFETLNPGFFETVELKVRLPPLGDPNYPKPGISLLVYDEDQGIFGEKKDLLGRVWIDLEKIPGKILSPMDAKPHEIYSHKVQSWYDLIFDATNSKEGKILVAYDIINIEQKDKFPLSKISIKPPTQPGVISMAIIGMRDIIPSLDLFPVKKIFCKFDISGDSKEPVTTNKHPVLSNSSNIFEIIALEIDVPLDIQYAPVLTVYIYDNLMGFLGNRLVGVANIPLEKYCKKVLQRLDMVSNVFAVKANDKGININSIQISLKDDPKQIETYQNLNRSQTIIKNSLAKAKESGQKDNTISTDNKKQTIEVISKDQPLNDQDNQKKEKPKITQEQMELEKLKQSDKKKTQVEEYKKKVEEEQLKQAEEKKQKEAERLIKQEIAKALKEKMKRTAKFMQHQVDYDSQPEEDLDQTPEWLKQRGTVLDELEDTLPKPPFDCWKIMRGQSRGKASMFAKTVQSNMQCTGIFKDIIKMKGKHQLSAEGDANLKQYLTPVNLVARLYILKGKSLTPKDSTTSDPYLIIKCAGKTITDKQSLRPKTCNPNFYTSYDIPVSLPGAATLVIECWDDDGFDFPDLIGSTKIDLEDRYFNKQWKKMAIDDKKAKEMEIVMKQKREQEEEAKLQEKKKQEEEAKRIQPDPNQAKVENKAEDKKQEIKKEEIKVVEENKTLDKKIEENKAVEKVAIEVIDMGTKMPIEERTLFIQKSSAPQGVLQCWLEILDTKDAGANPRIDISPLPKEDYELRVIIWGTRDCVFKDEVTKCNDLYLVGLLGSQKYETDTHWRCREKGSFNWRWKFPMTLPLDPDEDYGKDILTIQMWDRDITTANELIGELQIHLNDEQFRMLDKTYKRKQKVVMKKKDQTKAKLTTLDRFWVNVVHPEVKDKDDNYISQGFAEISIEILPKSAAAESNNGMGRDAPNQFPALPEPTGRFAFDLFSPWKMMKEFLGPSLARKICCVVYCTVFCLLFMYWAFFFGGNLIANAISNAFPK